MLTTLFAYFSYSFFEQSLNFSSKYSAKALSQISLALDKSGFFIYLAIGLFPMDENGFFPGFSLLLSLGLPLFFLGNSSGLNESGCLDRL